MAFKIDKKKYVDYVLYSVTPIKKGYGFRIKLIFDDESEKVQQRSGFKTKTAAKKERDIISAQLYNNTFIVYPNVKVEDFFTYWLEEIKVKIDGITYGTYCAYKNAIYNYIIPELGGYRMSTLNTGHIKRLYNKTLKQFLSVAKLVKTIMNTALDYAKDNNVVSVNVASNVSLSKKIKKEAYRTIKIDEHKTLTVQQCIELIKASRETPIYMQILFAILTGMRISEVLGLKFTDIDYINRKIFVDRQLGVDIHKSKEETKGRRSTQEIGVKTKSGNRWVGITDILFEEILECKKKYEKNKEMYKDEFIDEQFIICSEKGKPRCRTSHNKIWQKLKKDLNLPDIKFHDLRHTYGTLLTKANFNLKAISELLGHASEIITFDVYIDKNEIIYDCLDVLEPYIDSVIEKENEYDYGYIYDYTEQVMYCDLTEMYIDSVIDKEYKKGYIFDYSDICIGKCFSLYLKENRNMEICNSYC